MTEVYKIIMNLLDGVPVFDDCNRNNPGEVKEFHYFFQFYDKID